MSASNFCLKPIVCCANDHYFWIVTDPEDHAGRVRPDVQEDQDHGESKKSFDPEDHAGQVRSDSQEDQEQGESMKLCDPEDHASHVRIDSQEDQEQDKSKKPCVQQKLYSNKCKPHLSGNHEPQRYVRVDKGNLMVELNINPRSAKMSAFKLKNPRDDQTYPLHKSQWLPEALRGSQPYIIGCEGKPFRTGLKTKKVRSVYMLAEEGENVGYGKNEENKENVDWHGFFILESGHKT